jgi:hypothetical protein
MRFGALRGLGRCGLLIGSVLKAWTWPSASVVTAGASLWIKVLGSNPGSEIPGAQSEDQRFVTNHRQRAPETCIPSGTRFRERTPRRQGRRNDRRGTHEQCGPGGWPGPHFILETVPGLSPISRMK